MSARIPARVSLRLRHCGRSKLVRRSAMARMNSSSSACARRMCGSDSDFCMVDMTSVAGGGWRENILAKLGVGHCHEAVHSRAKHLRVRLCARQQTGKVEAGGQAFSLLEI